MIIKSIVSNSSKNEETKKDIDSLFLDVRKAIETTELSGKKWMSERISGRLLELAKKDRENEKLLTKFAERLKNSFNFEKLDYELIVIYQLLDELR